MQLFATFVKNKCNFFNFLLLQKLALVINNVSEMFPLINNKIKIYLRSDILE